ncbi:MAG: siroheme synthase CysG [Hydrogenovibrio sp.]|uniref:siroheme synthase CysG n=1 Tax=Hydrogenovibrio sp. TaxID=2065821 RepID=UPI00287019DD|nr:siroheme synthase CysG [Hydrogenovibrio sp.]MDR9499755.1 siroheme synthase CysG [Hydrogenovibrio sp.]
MDYLPIFVNLKQQPVLVVGGGEIALRKVRLLLQAQAQVTLVATHILPTLLALQEKQPGLAVLNAAFHPEQLSGMKLVIAATDDSLVNQNVFNLAEAKGVLVNVVDNGSLCRFIFPAIVDRSPLMLAISSGGNAPVLARHTRAQLEQQLPRSLADLGRLAEKNRDMVKSCLTNINQRRAFWEQALTGDVARLVEQQKFKQAQRSFENGLKTFQTPGGFVSIVGAGPGDPELLTLKALQAMQKADVVVHDGLIPDSILDLSRRDAERISVAKKAGCHSFDQSEINTLLIKLAQQGLQVCRLKGGDPFIFGRGGEECQALKRAGITYQVVPGITAAAGCAAYAGIPLTHRDHAQTLQVVTGHCKALGKEPNWRCLAQSRQTLVVYMGLINSATLSQKLIEGGRDASTPASIIEKGTQPEQRVINTRLGQLSQDIEHHHVQSPALIVIGEVCELALELGWYGHKQEERNDDSLRTA